MKGMISMHSDNALAIALPPFAGAAGGAAAGFRAHWWRIVDGRIIDRGDDWARTGIAHSLTAETEVLGIAPVSAVSMHAITLPPMAPRQMAAAARLQAAERCVEPIEQLHIVPVIAGDADGDGDAGVSRGGATAFAATSRAAMALWTEWAGEHVGRVDAIVPMAMLAPAATADAAATRAVLGHESALRLGDAVFPAEAELIDALVGPDATITDISPAAMDAAIIRACDAPPLNLLSGDYAPRAAALFSPALIKRAAQLAGLILILSLAILLVQLVRLNSHSAALDEAASTAAASVLGGTPPPAEQASGLLDTRIAALGGDSGRVTALLAALVSAMEPHATVSIDTLSWQGAGTLSATIAAPRTEDINAVLLAIQADGFTITATPRSGTDGRQLADITIRNGL